jgi:hypothetical protein
MQPLDIISGSLLDIGARAAGELAPPEDYNEGLILLNQVLDGLNNESMFIFCKDEIIHEIVGGQYIYTIGNGGQIKCTFTGSIAPNANAPGSILTITSIASGAISVGQVFTASGITQTIISYGTGVGGNTTSALGTYMLSIDNQTLGSGSITSYPQRPLKIQSGFVRVVSSSTGTLDYPIGIMNVEQYEMVGQKTLPGPWPRGVYYQPSIPLGVLNYWPNPSQGEMHLFADRIIQQFQTINDTVIMPQGSAFALRRILASELIPSFGKSELPGLVAKIERSAAQAKGYIKRTNMAPVQKATFDSILIPGQINNAGFILNGGFA